MNELKELNDFFKSRGDEVTASEGRAGVILTGDLRIDEPFLRELFAGNEAKLDLISEIHGKLIITAGISIMLTGLSRCDNVILFEESLLDVPNLMRVTGELKTIKAKIIAPSLSSVGSLYASGNIDLPRLKIVSELLTVCIKENIELPALEFAKDVHVHTGACVKLPVLQFCRDIRMSPSATLVAPLLSSCRGIEAFNDSDLTLPSLTNVISCDCNGGKVTLPLVVYAISTSVKNKGTLNCPKLVATSCSTTSSGATFIAPNFITRVKVK